MTNRIVPVLLLLLLLAGAAPSAFASKGHIAAAGKHAGRTIPAQGELRRPPSSPLDVVYTSTNVPVDIPDGPGGDTAVSILTIPDGILIEDLNVMVSITHTWIRDLRISLVSPSGIEVVLLNLFPADSIVNLTETWFDDDAAVRIDSGAPPFTGRFRPQNPLAPFEGMNAQGTWTLRVLDRFALDVGTIDAWAVEINRPLVLTGTVTDRTTFQPLPQVRVDVLPAGITAFTGAQGEYGFEALAPDTYTVRFALTDYETLEVPGVVIVEGEITVLDTSLYTAIQRLNFSSESPPENIPDANLAGAQMMATVPDSLLISDLDITVNMTHTYTGDIDLYLISPHADTVQLLFVGASCIDVGQNLVNTRFDDEAEIPFTQGSAPFTGSFRPHGLLRDFDSTNAQGTWTLWAVDNCEGDVGVLQNFTLHVQTGWLVSTGDVRAALPAEFIFHGAFPNPFNVNARFRFELARNAHVELALFDIAGRRAATIIDRTLAPGEHGVSFNAAHLPSGLYFARLTTLSSSQTRKVILLK